MRAVSRTTVALTVVCIAIACATGDLRWLATAVAPAFVLVVAVSRWTDSIAPKQCDCADLLSRSVFDLSDAEHRRLIASRLAEYERDWLEYQVGGLAGGPSILRARDVAAVVSRWLWRE